MSHENPCCHDCTDFDDPATEDAGCCSPAPTRRTCEAPVLPVPECDAAPAVIDFDPVTERFTAVAQLFDQNCLPLLDEDSEPLLAQIS